MNRSQFPKTTARPMRIREPTPETEPVDVTPPPPEDDDVEEPATVPAPPDDDDDDDEDDEPERARDHKRR